jgi:hypothetical protein
LFRFLCVYFLTFTVFIFHHYLLSYFAIGTYIFYIYFFLSSFSVRFIFFLKQTLSNDAISLRFSTSLHIHFDSHSRLTYVKLSDWSIGMYIIIFLYI